MPIKAIRNGEAIYSFQYSDEEWNDLKANYKENGVTLMMYCCDTPAIPKTSQRGLQFFAHKFTGDCLSQAESPEHEFVKFEVAKAVHELGWDVETEKSGVSGTGDDWRADVFCTKGNVKIAFEIQNSRQHWSEIERRQQRYKDSGVRCAWFLNNKAFKIENVISSQSRELPAFTYQLEVVGKPTFMDFFGGTAGEFAVQLLSKNVHWIDREKYSSINVCEHPCWKCGNSTKSVLGLSGSNFDNGRELSDCLNKFKVEIDPAPSFFSNNKIGFIRRVKYRDGESYFSPLCYHCKAIQGVHQLSTDVWNYVNEHNGKESSLTGLFSMDLPVSYIAFGGPVPGYWECNGQEMKYHVVFAG